MQPLTVRARARVVSLNDRCFSLAHRRAPSRVRPPRHPRYRICASQTHGACADTSASAAPDAALAENPASPYQRHEGRKMKKVRFIISHKVRLRTASRPNIRINLAAAASFFAPAVFRADATGTLPQRYVQVESMSFPGY